METGSDAEDTQAPRAIWIIFMTTETSAEFGYFCEVCDEGPLLWTVYVFQTKTWSQISSPNLYQAATQPPFDKP